MGRIAYLDCPSGAAGDMILGALVDAGLPLDRLRDELRKLPLDGWDLSAREVRKGAFRALKVEVEIDPAAHRHDRGLAEILALIRASTLADVVQERAGRVFTRLAGAEARVHGTTPERVHFHDVGAVDAIIDVTGSVTGLFLLGVEAVHVSALPLGGGLARGPHGRIPVPGPATLELLRGFRLVDPGIQAELVTPTGAALISTLASPAASMPGMTLSAIGYGAGTMDLPDRPNVLRCLLGDAERAGARQTVMQLETTIDDMSPQLYEPLMDRLLEAGALDVFLTPVVMKRSRPGVVVTVLCAPGEIDGLSRVLFEESSTIGVRWSARERTVLEREIVTVDTPYGAIRAKISRLGDRALTVTPEYADAVRLAREHSVPVREVLDRARASARRLLDGEPA
jgi:uncharacterized protein (TIGR00299 family) protein